MAARLAGKALLKMMKRWPNIISKCVLTLTENLRNPKAPEYAVLGSCVVLGTQTVLKRLTTVGILYTLLSKNHLVFVVDKFYFYCFQNLGSKGIFFVSSWNSFKVTIM